MIRGKKMRKPLRKLKIQEKAEMEQELTPDFIDENEELTLLSSVNIIVTLAESFDAILGGTDTVGAISFWDQPYVPEELDPNESWSDDEVYIDDKNVVYTMDRKRLLYARIGLEEAYYEVLDGTLTICDQAFIFHKGYLVLSVPASIKVIGDDIFGKNGGKIIVREGP